MKRKNIRVALLALAAMFSMLPARSSMGWVACRSSWHGGYYGHTTVVAGGYHGAYAGAVYHGGVYHAAWGCTGPGWNGVAAGAVAGFAAGTAVAAAQAPVIVTPNYYQPYSGYVVAPTYGSTVIALPTGSQAVQLNGVLYYNYADIWYKPVFGGNGVYYVVVPQP